jgi:hypothetical protein
MAKAKQASFGPELFSFLADLRTNNNREWFAARARVTVLQRASRNGSSISSAVSLRPVPTRSLFSEFVSGAQRGSELDVRRS